MNYNSQHKIWTKEVSVVTRQRKQLAIDMNKAGVPVADIAATLDRSPSRIYQYLKG